MLSHWQFTRDKWRFLIYSHVLREFGASRRSWGKIDDRWFSGPMTVCSGEFNSYLFIVLIRVTAAVSGAAAKLTSKRLHQMVTARYLLRSRSDDIS
jgi:hypothetical protein